MEKRKTNTALKDLILSGLFGALLLAVQAVLAPLPNVELVSLLVADRKSVV